MLKDLEPLPVSPTDDYVFEMLVAPDHPLRRALECIDFVRLRNQVTSFYSPDHGRPAEPLLMIKLELLQYLYGLSDRQVIARSATDVAFRMFLGLRLVDRLPDPSSLSVFRGRLGVDGHRRVFHALVGQARDRGLVKDRLRIKDATHVIAEIAIPSTLALVAQIRNRLLDHAEPFEAVRVAGERARVEMIRIETEDRPSDEQLLARVTHVRELLAWMDDLTPPENADDDRTWQRLVQTRRLAHKILEDQDHPERGDRTLSVVDPDARRGKHHGWYDGYLLDVTMDADSEIITAVDVLPANGDEAKNAAELIRQEQRFHGNRIEKFSIDGIGFQGVVLAELQDPAGLALDVYVPPRPEPVTPFFTPADFTKTTDATQGAVTCPAGEKSRYRQRDQRGTAWIYRFAKTTCEACPLLARCMAGVPKGPFGRTVHKNDYEKEYQTARRKAQTPEYQAVRAEHPKIERKLSDLIRWHSARRARCRGRAKVLRGGFLAALAANTKRVIRLLYAPQCAPAPA